ncbi:hypothetical protein LUZ63_017005 [Rhynchospora breviuscula]|uniref:C2 domain-containing protein n=1 Tax=Rhynchospora breviuscula TaxID=2022672 RepID=A0A9Q0C1N2_9POAL|nr:hypothetical protein LUZ63_017005 [Rhynchospora breviuscula]
MNKQSIFLKSISCKGIKSSNLFQSPSLYVAVSLSTTSQRHKTPVDTANGENPEWDCRMRFHLPASPPSDGRDLFLEFDLTAKGFLGDRIVGTARVPVSDLINGGSRGHVSYQVRWPDGKSNGTIQLWYELEGSKFPREMPFNFSAEPSAPPAADFSSSYKPPIELGSVYPPTLPGTASVNSQPVNPVPVCYPPMPGLATYNSGEPDRINWTPAGTEFMPYPPPPSSGLYPPVDSCFGSMAPCYPPPEIHNPPMDLAVSGSVYYPPPGAPYPPVHHVEGRSYPPPGTQYPPAFRSDCCDNRCRKLEEPVVAYPAGNGYYPPPPRYPYS